jgi:hypothetical protein
VLHADEDGAVCALGREQAFICRECVEVCKLAHLPGSQLASPHSQRRGGGEGGSERGGRESGQEGWGMGGREGGKGELGVGKGGGKSLETTTP